MCIKNLDYLINKSDWTAEDEYKVNNLDKKKRAYLGKKIKGYDGILVDLSFDQEIEVRLSVAQNSNAPIDVLKRMSNEDDNEKVRIEANKTLKELL